MKVEESSPASALSVSIVVYHSDLERLRQTLASLAAACTGLGGVRVCVVDNASGRDYAEQLAGLLDALEVGEALQVALITAPRNLGYGGGHNRALAGGVGAYHLVLNPDVEIAQDALRVGIDYLAAHPQTALLSPRAEGADGQREFLCKRYPSLLVLALRAFAPGLGERLFPARMADYEMRELEHAAAPAPVVLASGCFMLARGSQLLRTGGFDERFFMYFEDFDLSLRMAQLGAVVFHPGMRIVHHGGYAARKGFSHLRMFGTSALRFFASHGWRWI
ncbi:glycosyltransferase family 2 protein [Mangrovimicrobium sediminis]|uniref:Glycosyltransferase family 2 protein n=1 Tax=Mangrovimicrobium sediminis TaxID=2562682 RepID=A0A4Z0LUX1_9GAMM|nr:glycosyltransferase family 2 protein [Haliea sp. SAOS-164]TGD71183.1 glycosyltransferase family 2 protein [Haliea sp. SAOS-164]